MVKKDYDKMTTIIRRGIQPSASTGGVSLMKLEKERAEAVRENLVQNSQMLNALFNTVEQRFIDAGFGVEAEVRVKNPTDENDDYTLLSFRRHRGSWQLVIETGTDDWSGEFHNVEVVPLSAVSRELRLAAAPEFEALWAQLLEKASDVNAKCAEAISHLEQLLEKTAGFHVTNLTALAAAGDDEIPF